MKTINENDRIILIENNKEIGELKYKIIDDEIVLMGTYVNSDFRGNGYFKLLMKTLMDNNKNTTIYVCCVEPFLYLSLEKLGFIKIEEPIPFWGVVSNGINFKYIP